MSAPAFICPVETLVKTDNHKSWLLSWENHPTRIPPRSTTIDAKEFLLISHWRMDAPIDRVWHALHEPPNWPLWWRFVAKVDRLASGNDDGVGARYRFHWTSRLPYSFHLDMEVVEIAKPRLIRARAWGDLQGEGIWRLAAHGDATGIEYTWRVRLDRAWMRRFAPLLHPVFAWNHKAVMAVGETGLRRYLTNGICN